MTFLSQNQRKRLTPLFKRTREGVSLIIALFMISIIMILSVAISNLVNHGFKDAANVNHSKEAYYAAEAALEQGLLANAKQGVGYDQDPTPVSLGNGPLSASFSIRGTVPENSKLGNSFVIPTPGTGTAGKNCDPLKVEKGPWSYTIPTVPPTVIPGVDPLDHPCNWNKIKVGETVDIPLYVVTSDAQNCPTEDPTHPGSFICNPSDLKLNSLVLKVRTPCNEKDPQFTDSIDKSLPYCAPGARYDLDTDNGDPVYKSDDPIMSWKITGISANGADSYVLQPSFEKSWNQPPFPPKWKPPSNNAFITEGKLHDTKSLGALVLTGAMASCEDLETTPATTGTLMDFLKNTGSWSGSHTEGKKLIKPILKLSVIHSLDPLPTSSDKVPYLEYQLLTDTGLSAASTPADSAQTITAEGASGPFRQVLEVKIPQQTGLIEYVIQQ